MIAVAPIVADAFMLIDDKRVDAELAEARCDIEARLTTTDDNDRRIAVVVSLRRDALVEPVRPAKIPGVALPLGTIPAGLFFEVL